MKAGGLENLQKPDFESTILLADALDTGWMPYLAQADGVLCHNGHLVSHASMILKASNIPTITQFPKKTNLKTGDWIEMDAASGEVRKLFEEEALV